MILAVWKTQMIQFVNKKYHTQLISGKKFNKKEKTKNDYFSKIINQYRNVLTKEKKNTDRITKANTQECSIH